MIDTSEQQKQLQNLLLSDDFVELCVHKENFNIFQVLNLQNNEVKHSNFLGWLLTPFENHHLQDLFLKEILKIALKEHFENSNIHTTVADIILNDLTDAKVYLEKYTDKGRRMDIFIDCPTNKLVCVIENKIWSGEGCNQLEDYEVYVNSHEKYKNYTHKIFIFLTPNEDYDCTQLYKNYIRLDYKKISKAIGNLLKRYGVALDDNVRYFIEDYKSMIERDIMGIKDKEIVTLCRKIYRENKNAIDLIMENVSCSQDDIYNSLETIIKANDKLVLEPSKKPTWLRFTPNCVDYSKLNFAKSDWVESNKIIMLEINNCNREQLCVDIIVRKSDNQEKLKEILDVAKDIFGYDKVQNGYAHVCSKPLIHANEYYDFISNDDITSILKNRLDQSGIIAEFECFANKVLEKF